jgi:hypothetical protein
MLDALEKEKEIERTMKSLFHSISMQCCIYLIFNFAFYFKRLLEFLLLYVSLFSQLFICKI